MANVLIRDVPDETHDRLKAKATAAGMSLQAFLTRLLDDEARKPMPGEWAAEVERRLRASGAKPGDVTPEEIVEDIRRERLARERHLDEVLRGREP